MCAGLALFHTLRLKSMMVNNDAEADDDGSRSGNRVAPAAVDQMDDRRIDCWCESVEPD